MKHEVDTILMETIKNYNNNCGAGGGVICEIEDEPRVDLVDLSLDETLPCLSQTLNIDLDLSTWYISI